MRLLRPSLQRGFTLIEAIAAITITGIIAAVVAVFIAKPVQGYVDSVRRAGLTDAADLVLKRVSLEIRTAIPNSVIASGDSIEFIPTSTGGRYCNGSRCDELFDNDNTFDVLGPPVTTESNEQLVVFNTSQTGLNAYEDVNNNRRSLIVGARADYSTLTFSGAAFEYESPDKRFQIVPETGPVTFKCSGNQLLRYTGYGYEHDPETVDSNLMTDKLAINSCSFVYSLDVSGRNGLVKLSLTLTDSGESVTLHQEIHVENLP